MEPYSQHDHDVATEVGGMLLLVAAVPVVIAFVAFLCSKVLP